MGKACAFGVRLQEPTGCCPAKFAKRFRQTFGDREEELLMGGFGSGGWNATGRPTVEEIPHLDVMQLRKAGALEDGWRGGWKWRWSDGRRSNIAVTVEGELVQRHCS